MHRSSRLAVISALAALPLGTSAAQSAKRGLVYITNTNTPGDNRIWVPPASGLTWYYNYGIKPASLYDIVPQETFEFVPNMWGIGDDPKDTSFLGGVTEMIRRGRNIKHVLSFNDPDATWDVGGSNLDPKKAAQAWVANMVPLQKMGVKVSLPSLLTDHGPDTWIPSFLANCSEILKKECTYDFLGLHVYGDMTELESRVGKFAKAYVHGAPREARLD